MKVLSVYISSQHTAGLCFVEVQLSLEIPPRNPAPDPVGLDAQDLLGLSELKRADRKHTERPAHRKLRPKQSPRTSLEA